MCGCVVVGMYVEVSVVVHVYMRLNIYSNSGFNWQWGESINKLCGDLHLFLRLC